MCVLVTNTRVLPTRVIELEWHFGTRHIPGMISISAFFCFPLLLLLLLFWLSLFCALDKFFPVWSLYFCLLLQCCCCYCLPPPLHWLCWVQQCVVLSALWSETNEFRSGCYHSRHRCSYSSHSSPYWKLERRRRQNMQYPTIQHEQPDYYFPIFTHSYLKDDSNIASFYMLLVLCQIESWAIRV